MLQITESISWNKESALQSQAMENTAWHYLSTKMEPLGLYLSTCNKAGFNGVQSQHVLLFWHLNLEMRGTLRVHHFPDALHQESRKDLKRPDCTERLKHGHGTAALPNSILGPDKTKAGLRWLNADDGSPALPGLPSEGWDGDTTQLGLQKAEGQSQGMVTFQVKAN